MKIQHIAYTKGQIEALQDYEDDLAEMEYSSILTKYSIEIEELIEEVRKDNLPIDSVIIRSDIYEAMRKEVEKMIGRALPCSKELEETKRGDGSVFGYNLELNSDLSADKFKIKVC